MAKPVSAADQNNQIKLWQILIFLGIFIVTQGLLIWVRHESSLGNEQKPMIIAVSIFAVVLLGLFFIRARRKNMPLSPNIVEKLQSKSDRSHFPVKLKIIRLGQMIVQTVGIIEFDRGILFDSEMCKFKDSGNNIEWFRFDHTHLTVVLKTKSPFSRQKLVIKFYNETFAAIKEDPKFRNEIVTRLRQIQCATNSDEVLPPIIAAVKPLPKGSMWRWFGVGAFTGIILASFLEYSRYYSSNKPIQFSEHVQVFLFLSIVTGLFGLLLHNQPRSQNSREQIFLDLIKKKSTELHK